MDEKKTVLVVGGTGLVGQALVMSLLKKGFVIKILTRDIEKARKIFPGVVVIYKWPNGNEKLLLHSSEGCDAVINLAGENIGAKPWTKKYKKRITESRVHSVNNLYAIIKSMKQEPRVWIQASATGYYGFNTSSSVDESAPHGNGFLAGVVKEWENTFNSVSLNVTRKVLLRFGVVISPTGGFLQKMKQAFNMGVAVCPGKGTQKLSWIHIDDLVEIIYQAIVNVEYKDIINTVTPNAISLWEFTKLLKRNSQALIKIHVPAWVFRLVLGKQKADEMVLANQDVVPKQLLAFNFQYCYPHFYQVFE